jgi:Tfp pilus assembly protein PilO
MFKLVIPIILIAVSITAFLALSSPLYRDILVLRETKAAYNQALGNSKMLENERDKLTKKYNSINPDDLTRLVKMLPDNVDNIRLILEIEKIALPYGMVLRDVKYDTLKEEVAEVPPPGVIQGGMVILPERKDYGSWTLEFATNGSYVNFINFLRDLERNLRIVDVSSLSFASGSDVLTFPLESYRYSFKIKTYWLKN